MQMSDLDDVRLSSAEAEEDDAGAARDERASSERQRVMLGAGVAAQDDNGGAPRPRTALGRMLQAMKKRAPAVRRCIVQARPKLF